MQEYRPDAKTIADDTARSSGAVPFVVAVDTPFGAYPVDINKFGGPGQSGVTKGKGKKVSRVANPLRESTHVHVRAYSPADWFTVAGVAKKRRLIEAKGLPSFKGWRFITLTLNRDLFEGDALKGYLAGKERVRLFMFRARRAGLWSESARWCWKMEFQEDGWAHWHLWVDRKTKMTTEQLAKIGELWGLGRTNVKMVDSEEMSYEFKYAFKAAIQRDESTIEDHSVIAWSAPAWFLDHFKPSDNGSKPQSFSRVRFWQTSKGFYTGKPPAVADSGDPCSCIVPRPVRDVATDRASTIQVVARKLTGGYVASAVITLSVLTGLFWDRVGFDVFHSEAVGLGVNTYVIPTDTLKRNTPLWQTPKLKLILASNRLRKSRAVRLQQEGQTLRTC